MVASSETCTPNMQASIICYIIYSPYTKIKDLVSINQLGFLFCLLFLRGLTTVPRLASTLYFHHKHELAEHGHSTSNQLPHFNHNKIWKGMVVYSFNPITQEAGAGRLSFQNSQDYIGHRVLCQNKQNTKTKQTLKPTNQLPLQKNSN